MNKLDLKPRIDPLHHALREKNVKKIIFGENKAQLEQRGTKYKILDEAIQPDGSLLVQVERQNNYHSVGCYLD